VLAQCDGSYPAIFVLIVDLTAITEFNAPSRDASANKTCLSDWDMDIPFACAQYQNPSCFRSSHTLEEHELFDSARENIALEIDIDQVVGKVAKGLPGNAKIKIHHLKYSGSYGG
jgi:hypothetical protein